MATSWLLREITNVLSRFWIKYKYLKSIVEEKPVYFNAIIKKSEVCLNNCRCVDFAKRENICVIFYTTLISITTRPLWHKKAVCGILYLLYLGEFYRYQQKSLKSGKPAYRNHLQFFSIPTPIFFPFYDPFTRASGVNFH